MGAAHLLHRVRPNLPTCAAKKGRAGRHGHDGKQSGSDVRANVTRAQSLGDGEYELHGDKWFCSAPMSDAFLVLAKAPRGLSCFLLPRWKPDGRVNAFHLQRLKPKLGNRSNASSEVEFDGACAQLLGEEGRGAATIMEMVQQTRLDCISRLRRDHAPCRCGGSTPRRLPARLRPRLAPPPPHP